MRETLLRFTRDPVKAITPSIDWTFDLMGLLTGVPAPASFCLAVATDRLLRPTQRELSITGRSFLRATHFKMKLTPMGVDAADDQGYGISTSKIEDT